MIEALAMASHWKPASWMAFSLLLACTALAQPPVGRVEATVVDTAGTAISLASLRLLNMDREARQAGSSRYVLEGITAGSYLLEATAEGYAPAMVSLRVEAGQTARIAITLQRAWLTLGEVSVQSDRLETREAVTAASVTAFTARDIRASRLWSLQDISALVPGLYSAHPGDGRNVTTIRGIGTTSYDPAIVTYVDGVSQFNLDTYIPQLIDAERIEVLRGPQGTLFGRNAMGGVIQVKTRQPGNRTRLGLEIHVGNFGLRRSTGTLKAPLVKDRLYIGVALQQEQRAGYFQNLFTGNDFDGYTQRTANLSLQYFSRHRWTATLNVKGHRTLREGAFPLAGNVKAALKAPFVLDQNALARMRDLGANASLSLTRRGEKVRMDIQTAWQSNHRIYEGLLDGDFSRADIVSIYNDYGDRFNRVRVWTQEWRWSSVPKADEKLSWLSGLYLFTQDNPTRQATVFGKDAGLFGIPDKNFSLIQQNMGKGSGAALFGQASYALSKRLQLVGGLRLDQEWRRLEVRGEYEKGTLRFLTRSDTTTSQTYQAISPKAGLEYTLPKKQLVYLTYSRGFRAGGLTPMGSDPRQPPLASYAPEYSDNLELGWKGRGDADKLSYRAAAFLTAVSDAQVPTLLLPDAVTVTRNAGRMRSYGLEASSEARIWNGLSLTARMCLTHARFTRLLVPDNGRPADLSGNRQVFTPTHTGLLTLEYVKPLGRQQRWRLESRGEGLAIGSQYFDLANRIEQPAYVLFHARLGLAGPRWAVHCWGRNLTGRTYISYAYDFGAAHLGPPRTWGATVSRGF